MTPVAWWLLAVLLLHVLLIAALRVADWVDDLRDTAARAAVTPSPERVLLEIADLVDYEADAVDALRQIAMCARSASGAERMGLPPGWAARERDRLVDDLLDQAVPAYTARKRARHAARTTTSPGGTR